MRLTDLAFTLVLTGGLGLLCSCGIKPSQLSPPPGTQKDSYPQVYPDPATETPLQKSIRP